MTIGPGKTLLHYCVGNKIGEGAMGAVWKARDTTLDRDVALKVLPAAFAEDPRRLARFEREARLMASLQHPNVAAVFGVHETDGVRFLAMEYVPGEDLADRLARGPMPIEEIVRIAGLVTRGVEAAHANGVVHRDLKPANVRLTPTGEVKVLDFGLAKAVAEDPEGESPDVGATLPGVVLGTAPYMSPEQVRGQAIDARSDIWSFGCMVWECLTGRSPFHRESTPEAIGAILHHDPDLAALPPHTPASVRRLLRRCLVRDRDRRLHHIADARLELEATDVEAETLPGPPEAMRRAGGYRMAVGVLGLAVLVLAVLLAGRDPGAGQPVSTPENPLAGARFTKLTAWPGSEIDAAISPNGRFVAFLADRDGTFEAYVGLIGAGEYRSLTEGWAIDDIWAEIRQVGFVGNGSEVWIKGLMRPDDPDIRDKEIPLRAAPLLGGPLRTLLAPDAVNAGWTQDGRRVVYHDSKPGDPLYVADAVGADPVEVPIPSEAGNHQHHPTWSPDGTWIYVTRGRPAAGDMDLWRVRPDGRDLQQLTHGKRSVMYPAPLDDRTVLYVAQEESGAGPWLWALDLETGTSRRATLGIERYTSIAASTDGRRLVATVSNPRSGLWTVPLRDGIASEQDVAHYPLPSVRALGPRIRGDALYYLSSESGADGLWRHRDGKVREVWRGEDGALLVPAAISADGTRLALILRKEGRNRLHVLSTEGTVPRPLAQAVDVRGAASWSPDGTALVVGGVVGAQAGLFRVPADGGRPRRLVGGDAFNPVWSPRGDLIVYGGAQVRGYMKLHGVRPDTGASLELPDATVLRTGERFRFLPDGSGIVYLAPETTAQDFWLLDLETMATRRLTRFESRATPRTFDVTPDGSTIVFDRLREDSDVVLIERAPGG